MTSAQILQVVRLYQQRLQEEGFEAARYKWPDMRHQSRRGALNHVLHMCNEVKKFVKAEELEKAFRWLGFMQGVLWVCGMYSIDEMRGHNK